MELFFEILILCVDSIALGMNWNNSCSAIDFKKWFIVFAAYILIGRMVLSALQLHYIQIHRRENTPIFLLSLVSEGFLCAWLIYANIIFFSPSQDEQKTCSEDSSSLFYIMFGTIIVGYLYMMKCAAISIFIFCCLPIILVQAYRRARRPDWVPAPNRLIERLVPTQFDPRRNRGEESCPICLDDYKPNDEIIKLPCDERHFFHSHCIKDWLKNNNNCPMCKKELTGSIIERANQNRP